MHQIREHPLAEALEVAAAAQFGAAAENRGEAFRAEAQFPRHAADGLLAAFQLAAGVLEGGVGGFPGWAVLLAGARAAHHERIFPGAAVILHIVHQRLDDEQSAAAFTLGRDHGGLVPEREALRVIDYAQLDV